MARYQYKEIFVSDTEWDFGALWTHVPNRQEGNMGSLLW